MHQILLDKHLWIASATTLAIGITLILLLHHFFFFFGERLTKRRKSISGIALLKQVKLPTRVILIFAVAAPIIQSARPVRPLKKVMRPEKNKIGG